MNARELFMVKRGINDIDLLLEVTKIMVRKCGKLGASYFRTNPEILIIEELNPASQRIIINRVLNQALLLFRAHNNINISEVMIYLINDGLNDEWLSLMEDVVLPFFAEHNILHYLKI